MIASLWWLRDGRSSGGTITPSNRWYAVVASQSYVAGSIEGDTFTAGPVASQGHLAGAISSEAYTSGPTASQAFVAGSVKGEAS